MNEVENLYFHHSVSKRPKAESTILSTLLGLDTLPPNPVPCEDSDCVANEHNLDDSLATARSEGRAPASALAESPELANTSLQLTTAASPPVLAAIDIVHHLTAARFALQSANSVPSGPSHPPYPTHLGQTLPFTTPSHAPPASLPTQHTATLPSQHSTWPASITQPALPAAGTAPSHTYPAPVPTNGPSAALTYDSFWSSHSASAGTAYLHQAALVGARSSDSSASSANAPIVPQGQTFPRRPSPSTLASESTTAPDVLFSGGGV